MHNKEWFIFRLKFLIVLLGGGMVLWLSSATAPDHQATAAVNAFGRGGFVTLEGMTAVSVDLQSNGKMIVLGNRLDGCKCMVLRRYHEDGRLDLAFGGGGQVTPPGDPENAYARKVLVTDDDRILVAARHLLARYLPDGQPDDTFSTDGFVFENDTRWTDLAVDGLGRIVVVGDTSRWIPEGAEDRDFAIGRYLQDGSPDSSFNYGGFDAVDFGGHLLDGHARSYDYARAVAIDADNRIIVAGRAQDSGLFNPEGEDDFAVARMLESGGLDRDFGDEGELTIGLGGSFLEEFTDVEVRPDGRILLAGHSAGNGNDRGLVLVQLRPNGDFDTSFNGNGKLIQQITQYNDEAGALHLLDDGRFLLAGAASGRVLLARFHADGSVDQSFSYSRQGKMPSYVPQMDLARQEDGKLVLAADNRLMRFNADGTLDTSYFPGQLDDTFAGFYSRGIIAENDFYINAVARQENGYIIAAGSSGGVNGYHDEASVITLRRYTPDGNLDVDFGEDGTAYVRLQHGAAFGVAIHPNGQIIVSGTTGSYAGEFFTVAALTPDGEATFVRLLNPGDNERIAYAVAVDGGGRIVAVGSAVDGDNHDFVVARLTAFGQPDSSFGDDGLVLSGLGESERATHIALQPDGKIVAAGTREESNLLGSDTDFIVARYLTNGQLDSSFDDDGKRGIGLGGDEFLGDLSLEPASNKIVLAGSGDGRLALVRLNPDGSRDSSFDSDGQIVHSNVGGAGGVDAQLGGRMIAAISQDGVVSLVWIKKGGALGGLLQRGEGILLGSVVDMVRDPDGKYLLAAGKSVARFRPDGQPDFSGATAYDMTPYENQAYGMALQDDGRMVVVGEVKLPGSNSDFSAVRFLPAGEVDRSFGNDGHWRYGGPLKDVADNVAVLADGRIAVTGWAESASQGANFLTVILSQEGIDEKILYLDFNRGNDVAQEVLPQADGGFIVVGHADNGSDREIALARYTAAGRLDTNFGNGGKVTTPVGSGYVSARGATLQPDGKILVAGGYARDFLVLRYNADGSLDTSFGEQGIVVIRPPEPIGEEEGKDIAVLSSGYIAVSGYSGGDFGLILLHPDGRICTTECNMNAAQPFLRTDFGGIEVPFAMAVQEDQRIIIAGGTRGTYPTESSIMVARYVWRVGRGYSLDTSFGNGGKLIDDPMPSAVARDVALDSVGRLLVAGYGHNYREYDLLLARYLTTSEAPPTEPDPPIPPPTLIPRTVHLPLVVR